MIALSRNAYIFAGSDPAGERSAMFYSLVATCLQHNVDFYARLAWVLPRLAHTRKSELVNLHPMNVGKTRAQRAAT